MNRQQMPASRSSVLDAALQYAEMGLSVLACEGKKPAINWTAFQHRAAHPMTIRKWDEVGLLQNVGIICGKVSGNLVVVDLDGTKAVEAYGMYFPSLTETFAVETGSGKGRHYYYFVRELPPTTRVVGASIGNVELRADGCYVVAPPSIHPETGSRYIGYHSLPIMILPDTRPVVAWVKKLIAEKHGGLMPPPANREGVKNASAWARAALAGECANVRAALPGARNNTLYRAALKMGSLIADGKLSEYEAEDALLEAAMLLTSTDGIDATLKTIFSGLKTGMESSRERHTKRA